MKELCLITTAGGDSAKLMDDGKWVSDDEDLAKYLNAMYSIKDRYTQRAYGGPKGFMAGQEAARALGGKFQYLQKVPRSEPGKVY